MSSRTFSTGYRDSIRLNLVSLVSFQTIPLSASVIIGFHDRFSMDIDPMTHKSYSSDIGRSPIYESLSTVLTDGIPKVGMKFETEDDAYSFYNSYAALIGFSVRKDFKNLNKIDGCVISRRFVCFKRGFRLPDKRNLNVKRPRKEVRTGCSAQLTISRQPDGKYRVMHFEERHNHEVTSPQEVHTLPSHRKATVSQAVESDRKLGFGLRSMKAGEAAVLLSYFRRQQLENSSFFYALQLDSDERIANVFWADLRMMIDYSRFGDVFYLDTSYRTNQLSRPLASFMGVNHHHEMVLFGVALLYDESESSFQWLFEAFSQVTSGKRPETILTVRDPSISPAIRLVFPGTSHRVCIRNMWQNAMRNLGHMFEDQESFGRDFRDCVFDHENEDEFFRAWELMVEKYGLRDNGWLREAFEEREKWATVYGRRVFSAGIKNTELSERFNGCLRRYFKSDSDILGFLCRFDEMLIHIRKNEVPSDVKITPRVARLLEDSTLLRHAFDVYTPTSFEIFWNEFETISDLVIARCTRYDTRYEYEISSFGKPPNRTVTFYSSDETVSCSCCKFESVGILCGHVLKVLDVSDVKMVPRKYILRRWTKCARFLSSLDSGECGSDPAIRYRNLRRMAAEISMMAAESEEGYLFLNKVLSEGMVELGRIQANNYPVKGGISGVNDLLSGISDVDRNTDCDQ